MGFEGWRMKRQKGEKSEGTVSEKWEGDEAFALYGAIGHPWIFGLGQPFTKEAL